MSLQFLFVFGQQFCFSLGSLFLDFVSFAIHEGIEGCQFITVGLLEVMHFPFVPLLHLIKCSGLQILLELCNLETTDLGFGVVGVLLVDQHQVFFLLQLGGDLVDGAAAGHQISENKIASCPQTNIKNDCMCSMKYHRQSLSQLERPHQQAPPIEPAMIPIPMDPKQDPNRHPLATTPSQFALYFWLTAEVAAARTRQSTVLWMQYSYESTFLLLSNFRMPAAKGLMRCVRYALVRALFLNLRKQPMIATPNSTSEPIFPHDIVDTCSLISDYGEQISTKIR